MDTSNRVEISTKGNAAGSASYVNAVKGVLGGKGNDKRMEDGSVQEERKLCLKAEGNGWLYRSAVAKLHRLISIDELKVQMARMGVNNVLVRAMGGRSVILTCNNNEELENLLKVNCLQRWFSEIKSWEGQAACIERFVWLCCYGIPLNGWSNTSFKAIGELWDRQALRTVDNNRQHIRSFVFLGLPPRAALSSLGPFSFAIVCRRRVWST
ncbi:hypothetical protein RHSIM_Rhsim01G0053100 [Rhododendron simsii]|uniref:DUF4283 domain-containing protein n=1 Tax=Rhododendron simsii TaxID=118357 RepID=A0A834HE85_RHOSS|nr:hypothetical protein RHSIM_Rhsim01G0053100 [Rhododendron simsii]